jgi:predicted adenine nucleotide alpha hydrolase (AANH) superfamily ATPase
VCDEGVEGLRDVVGVACGKEREMERETERGVEIRICIKMKLEVYTLAARSSHISHLTQASAIS